MTDINDDNYIKIELAAGKLGCSIPEFLPNIIEHGFRLHFYVYKLYMYLAKSSFDGTEHHIARESNNQHYTGWLEIGKSGITDLIYNKEPRSNFLKGGFEVVLWGEESARERIIGLNKFYIKKDDLDALLSKNGSHEQTNSASLLIENEQGIKILPSNKVRRAYHLEVLEELFVEMLNENNCPPSIGQIWKRLQILSKNDDLWKGRILYIDDNKITWQNLGGSTPTQKYATVINNISSLRTKYKKHYNL